eukprot:1161469-Pelagomonas_calceolata.AAC.41
MDAVTLKHALRALTARTSRWRRMPALSSLESWRSSPGTMAVPTALDSASQCRSRMPAVCTHKPTASAEMRTMQCLTEQPIAAAACLQSKCKYKLMASSEAYKAVCDGASHSATAACQQCACASCMPATCMRQLHACNVHAQAHNKH